MRPVTKKKDTLYVDDSVANRLMLAYLCIATEGPEASLVRKVDILTRFNLTNVEIARVCKCSIQSVANAKQIAKQKS